MSFGRVFTSVVGNWDADFFFFFLHAHLQVFFLVWRTLLSLHKTNLSLHLLKLKINTKLLLFASNWQNQLWYCQSKCFLSIYLICIHHIIHWQSSLLSNEWICQNLAWQVRESKIKVGVTLINLALKDGNEWKNWRVGTRWQDIFIRFAWLGLWVHLANTLRNWEM